MKMNIVFSLVAVISVSLTLAAALCAFFWRKVRNRMDGAQDWHTIYLMTGLMFAAAFVMYLPVYFSRPEGYFTEDTGLFFARPMMKSALSALRLFILDGDYQVINEVLDRLNVAPSIKAVYSVYAGFMAIAAPVLTVGNIAYLFKGFENYLRFLTVTKKPLYIMSDLNDRSVALAKSIREKDPKAVIVFTDVFVQNEEENYELMLEARALSAICLKTDVSHLNVSRKKQNVEFFIIGENEAENLGQALKVTKTLNEKNKKQNVKVFVFARSSGSADVLNSINYDNLLNYAAEHHYSEETFKLRRVDEVRSLIWNQISEMNLFDMAIRNGNTLSVVVAGMGSYGMEFFKAMIWFCQFEGIRLKLTVVDAKQEKKSGPDVEHGVTSMIKRQCPDILKTNRVEKEGDAYYDIEVIPDVDMTSSAFQDILFYEGTDPGTVGWCERLRSANLVFISLGNDDDNIETSLHLRSLYDRVHAYKATKKTAFSEEPVQIYSVVYDELKAGSVAEGKNSCLRNFKGIPYHIHFIGGMSSQFRYENIYDKQGEELAYQMHMSWADLEKKVHEELKEKYERSGKECVDPDSEYSWYYTYFDAASSERDFQQYEYYRVSSLAKAISRKMKMREDCPIRPLITCLEVKEGEQPKCSCMCENCARRKRSEHMRWNAYMRVSGFSYLKGIRADRAMLHNDLKTWDELSFLEQIKD